MVGPPRIWQPVYEKDPSISHMVWASNGYWYVGKRDELGKQAGWMQAQHVTACNRPACNRISSPRVTAFRLHE